MKSLAALEHGRHNQNSAQNALLREHVGTHKKCRDWQSFAHPTTMPATKDGLLTLELDPVLRVAGEEISGNVLLDFETLQRTPVQDICVYLNGSVFTYVVTL